MEEVDVATSWAMTGDGFTAEGRGGSQRKEEEIMRGWS